MKGGMRRAAQQLPSGGLVRVARGHAHAMRAACMPHRRWVSTRCLEYMEPWVWTPHTEDAGYFEELKGRALVDPVTGTHVHVVGVNECSVASAAAVREVIANTRAGARGRRAAVVLNWCSAELMNAVADACTTDAIHEREKAVGVCAELGYPPDMIAEGMANRQAYGLVPVQASQAAAAAAVSVGTPVHYLGLQPGQAFQRLRYINQTAAQFLAEADPDAIVHLTHNDMGLHPSHEAHLHAASLAEKLVGVPTPDVVHQQLTSVSVPALYFRHVQPTVHLVLAVRKLLPTLPFNDGVVTVVVDASVAPMFYKVFKDEGLNDVDACGMYHTFHNIESSTDQADATDGLGDDLQGCTELEIARRLEALDDANDTEQTTAQKQAEFEVQLLLFLHLSRVRPDLLRMKQAVANTYLVNGLVLDALMYLRTMVDAEVPGAAHMLNSMVDDMVREGAVHPDDDLVAYCMAAVGGGGAGAPEGADEAASPLSAPSEAPAAPLLLTASAFPDKKRPRVLRHDMRGKVLHTDLAPLPDVDNMNDGLVSSTKEGYLNNALALHEEQALSAHTPSAAKQLAIQRNIERAQGYQFSQTRMHPFSDEFKDTPNAMMPSEGVAFGMQRYRPHTDFPEPPPQEHALATHARASEAAMARLWSRGDAMDHLLKESQRVRTKSPARTEFARSMAAQRRGEREQVRIYKQRERSEEEWGKWGGREGFQQRGRRQ